MCGIVGILNYRNREPVDPELLRSMNARIFHRGPDEGGVLERPGLGLAMRRLTIIDLASGSQPMSTDDGKVHIVYNGEVWNYKELRAKLEAKGHRFHTTCDTESVLYSYVEWGEDCCEHLRGMYGFAIWDERSERLFVARDRMGKKPIYYYDDGSTIVFGSEIKSLLLHPAVPREVNLQGVADHLTLRYIPSPDTMFRGIRKLPPAHWMSVTADGVTLRRYWDFQFDPASDSRPYQDCSAELRERFTECVRMRLMSDVPLGATLSGGVDSTLIVALMRQMVSGPIQTFAVGYKEETHSELKYARLGVDRYDVEHHEVIVTCDDFIANLEPATWFRDEPVSEFAEIPQMLLCRLARKYVKVLLTGEGGDELFGGYPKCHTDRLAKWYHVLPRPLRDRVIGGLVQSLPFGYRRLKVAEQALRYDQPERIAMWFGSFDTEHKRSVLSPELLRQTETSVARLVEPVIARVAGARPVEQMLYWDLRAWLPDNLMMKADRMAMAVSLEARVPFLDHELVEFSARVPLRHKIKNGVLKYILKDTFRDLLPEEVITRRKAGFLVPVSPWFAGKLGQYLREVLTSAEARARGYYDMREVDRAIQLHFDRRQDFERELWTLLNLEIWHRVFIDRVPEPPAGSEALAVV
ncbi:MAG: asparagine synthetase B [Fimbriimonadales bacterium]